MGSAITRICVKFISSKGGTASLNVEGADKTIWKQDVYEKFGHYIDEGRLKDFLGSFNDYGFDRVWPTTDSIYETIAQMGGLPEIEMITFDYVQRDPYDTDYKYLLYLKGQPQAIEDDEADNDEIEYYVFNADVRECEGVLIIKYSNKVLENLLEEYCYSRSEGSNTLVRFDFDAPEYYGVENLDCLTETLIASLIRTGNGEAGLEQALVDAFDDICDAFTSIEGTAEEEIDPVGRSWGYDFELKDGVYRVEERECDGGW